MFITLGFQSCFAQVHIDIDENTPTRIEFPYINIFDDATGKMQVDEVKKRLKDFKIPDKGAESVPDHNYWIAVELTNKMSEGRGYRIDPGIFYSLQTYVLREDGKFQSIKPAGGIHQYNDLSHVSVRKYNIVNTPSKFGVFHLKPNTTTFLLIKIKDINLINFDRFKKLTLIDNAAMLETRRYTLYIEGALIGFLFALALFGWFNGFSNRDSTSFHYGVWILIALLASATTPMFDGIRFFEFFINLDGLKNVFGPYTTLFPELLFDLQDIAFVIFARSFLDLKIRYPRLYILTTFWIIYHFITTYLFDLLDIDFEYRQILIAIFFISILISIFIISIIRYFQGMRSASLFIIAMIPYLFFRISMHLRFIEISSLFDHFEPQGLGWLLRHSNSYVALGACSEAIIMAFAVISRTKLLNEQLKDSIKENQKILIEQNQTLEVKVKERTKELQLQTDKTEKLMLNILPNSIADRLKQGETDIADKHLNTTILFSDLVGFSKMSSQKSPEELVFLLNDLFKRFDIRATELGLEKIKTIGDAYMVAGGLPTGDDSHAIQVTKMALGMHEDLANFNKEHGLDFEMRIGINSGPVVAGIIGHSKFSYDLWGNTVNTASRMESTSIPGKVQVSPSTYELIKAHFEVRAHQEVECKGLGLIMTYFVAKST